MPPTQQVLTQEFPSEIKILDPTLPREHSPHDTCELPAPSGLLWRHKSQSAEANPLAWLTPTRFPPEDPPESCRMSWDVFVFCVLADTLSPSYYKLKLHVGFVIITLMERKPAWRNQWIFLLPMSPGLNSTSETLHKICWRKECLVRLLSVQWSSWTSLQSTLALQLEGLT
jgi:hypothetical protein